MSDVSLSVPESPLVIQDGELVVTQSMKSPVIPMADGMVYQSEGNSLKILVEAVHAMDVGNNLTFEEEDLKKSLRSWTKPYPRPILREHMMSVGFFGGNPDDVKPLGRVVSAKMAPSVVQGTEGVMAQLLTVQLSDPQAIEMVKDQRYLTCSVGVRAGKALCNICKHDFLASGEFCEHTRGKKYKGKLARWILKDLTFKELSFVNNPADTSAQVVAIDGQEDGSNSATAKQSASQLSEQSATQLSEQSMTEEGVQLGMPEDTNQLDSVDSLLNEEEETTTLEASLDEEGECISDGDDTPDGEVDNAEEDTEDLSEDDDATLMELQEKVTSLSEEIQGLKEANEGYKTALAEMKEAFEAMQAKMDEFTESTTSALGEAEETQGRILKQNVEMARLAKTQMAERKADLLVLSGQKTSDEWQSLYEEALSQPSKEVLSSVQDILKGFTKKPREITYVPPNTLATQTEHDEPSDDTDSPSQEDAVDVTQEEYLNTILQGLSAAMSRRK